ncbi:endogenous retrovirus group K member 10 Pro protein-like [Equus asinus]|uniref:endogenous retrovirus group K member 10 Pro protein-like n=1 Tax=Equus asinus TaxID=9793 RepID=UPI0038F6409F
MAFWLQEITSNRPMQQLIVEGIAIEELLDTGADVSCIAGKYWPSSLPIQVTLITLVGSGKAPQADKSRKILHWSDGQNNTGIFQPHVIPAIPFTLWGRDVLAQMGILLFSPDNKVTDQMLKMKYNPQKSLGKADQGVQLPISLQPNKDRRGFGYEPDCELSNLS